jgi:elongation factor P
MYQAADLRKGLKIEIDGNPYQITEFNFVKPGKGQGLYFCKLKNLANGSTMQRTFRSADRIDEPKIEERTLQYSYQEGDNYIFLDENYEQVSIAASALGEQRHFLVEEISVDVVYHNGKPIGITLPTFIEKEVIHTEPGARGDTATNVLKPATVAGGYQLQVPLFVNLGDIIRIDTRTGEYVDRVRK